MEGYELAGILAQKKNPVFAKAGQIAPEDIEVKAGPTDLVPGPAISELGSLGIQVAVEDGKISIKASKVVVNKNGVINESTASLLQKLNIQPFRVGLEPKVIYDIESEKVYADINVDSEGLIEELKSATGKALGFAQKIIYYCKDTIGYFLAKANADGQALEKLQPVEEDNKTKAPTESTNTDNATPDEASPASEIKEETTVNPTLDQQGQAKDESPASTTDNKDKPEAPVEEKPEEPNVQLNNPEETV